MPPDAATQPSGMTGAPRELEPGVWVLHVPLHARVEPVNAWLLRDGDGSLTVFDTGVAEGAEPRWRAALQAIGHQPSDVRRTVVSHHHPDHIGGSGALHRLTGAPLFASRSTIRQAPDVWGDRGRSDSYLDAIRTHLREHGLPQEVADMLAGEGELVRAAVDLPPDDAWHPLEEGDRLEVGDRAWRVRLTPGHADGHLVLHDEQGRLLLAGDHLLERISPAVGRFPRHERDPLGRYLESLMAISMLPSARVLPGHGDPFAGSADRARELVAHHMERIEQCVAAVLQLGSPTAWEVARVVFAHAFEPGRGHPADERFATTETLAHLERARIDGRVARARDAAGLVRWRAA